jgi:hypothetical protein
MCSSAARIDAPRGPLRPLARALSREKLRAMSPLAPVFVDRVLDDPSIVPTLVRRGGRYPTVQHYLRNLTEMAALSDAGRRRDGTHHEHGMAMPVAPWFRGDLALEGKPLVEGVGAFLENARFAEAARSVFGTDDVEPFQVYLNLNPPMPRVDPGHVDVPSFRGFDRRTEPVWLLVTMLKSGLFERWYVPTATGVAWYYEGEAGGFRYWGDGPHAPPTDLPCRTNTALVGDNDRMFHSVDRVGPRDVKPVWGLGMDATIALEDDTYVIRDGDDVRARYDYADVRLSISWKARVFRTPEDRARFDGRADLLDLEAVTRVFVDALCARGVEHDPPSDLRHDERFMKILNDAFHVAPTAR